MGTPSQTTQSPMSNSLNKKSNRITEINSISVLIPVFNAEKTIGPLIDSLVSIYRNTYESFEIVLVNDGSIDQSAEIIYDAILKYPGFIKAINLSKNFGEHNAVLCGLAYTKGDAVVIIDDDLQMLPSEIGLLIEKLKEGYDVVYSYYDQMHQPLHRRLGSWFSNWIATYTLGKPKGLYLSSFKALSSKFVKTISAYNGPFPYIDGIILRSTNLIGTQLVSHQRRPNGKSNYTIPRLIGLWMNMFTGFSIVPLRVASLLGFFFSLLGFCLSIFFTYTHLHGPIFNHKVIPPGWASLIVVVTFFGGIQLSVLGLVGEYLGRLFLTVNKLPQYVVRETIGFDE